MKREHLQQPNLRYDNARSTVAFWGRCQIRIKQIVIAEACNCHWHEWKAGLRCYLILVQFGYDTVSGVPPNPISYFTQMRSMNEMCSIQQISWIPLPQIVQYLQLSPAQFKGIPMSQLTLAKGALDISWCEPSQPSPIKGILLCPITL